jgi:hypothetical protein
MTINVSEAVSPFAGSPIASRGGLIPDGMLPAGYQETLVRDAKLVAHASAIRFLQQMLDEKKTLHGWAAAQPGARAFRGRGVAYAVNLPDTEVGVVVRHSAHGGTLAPVTKDAFRKPRAADELRLSWTLRHVGIPTPRVLGYALYPVARGLLWRADVVLREIPESWDLAAIFQGGGDQATLRRAVTATRTLLKQMSDVWCHHPDLNLKNILIAPDEDSTDPVAWLLDVDTVHFAAKDAEELNRQRLLRSARKWLNTDGNPGFAMLVEALEG